MTTRAALDLTHVPVLLHGKEEQRLRAIAREVALDILPLDQVLVLHGMDEPEWERIARQPSFQEMLKQERETWGSSLNTEERVKLKMWVMIEENLPTLHGYLNDPRFADAAKVDIFKTLSKNVGMGVPDRNGVSGGAGERFVLNINMGTKSVSVEKDITPSGNAPIIEHYEGADDGAA